MMKSTGLQRKVDEMGRIVIPRDLRKMANIRDGEMLEFLYDADAHTIGLAPPPHFSEETEKLLTLVKDVISFPLTVQVNNIRWAGSVLVPNPQQTYSFTNSRNEQIELTVCADDVKNNKQVFVFLCKMLSH